MPSSGRRHRTIPIPIPTIPILRTSSPVNAFHHCHRYRGRDHRRFRWRPSSSGYSRCNRWSQRSPTATRCPQRRGPSPRHRVPDQVFSLSCPHPSSPPFVSRSVRWIISSRLVDSSTMALTPQHRAWSAFANLRCRARHCVHPLASRSRRRKGSGPVSRSSVERVVERPGDEVVDDDPIFRFAANSTHFVGKSRRIVPRPVLSRRSRPTEKINPSLWRVLLL